MLKANVDIREEAKAAKVPLWAIGDRLYGVNEVTMIRRLRKELAPQEKAKIRNTISELKEENKVAD